MERSDGFKKINKHPLNQPKDIFLISNILFVIYSSRIDIYKIDTNINRLNHIAKFDYNCDIRSVTKSRKLLIIEYGEYAEFITISSDKKNDGNINKRKNTCQTINRSIIKLQNKPQDCFSIPPLNLNIFIFNPTVIFLENLKYKKKRCINNSTNKWRVIKAELEDIEDKKGKYGDTSFDLKSISKALNDEFNGDFYFIENLILLVNEKIRIFNQNEFVIEIENSLTGDEYRKIEGKSKEEIEGKSKEEIEGKSNEEIECKSKEEIEGKLKEEIECKSKEKIEGKSKEEIEGKSKEEIEGKSKEEIEYKNPPTLLLSLNKNILSLFATNSEDFIFVDIKKKEKIFFDDDKNLNLPIDPDTGDIIQPKTIASGDNNVFILDDKYLHHYVYQDDNKIEDNKDGDVLIKINQSCLDIHDVEDCFKIINEDEANIFLQDIKYDCKEENRDLKEANQILKDNIKDGDIPEYVACENNFDNKESNENDNSFSIINEFIGLSLDNNNENVNVNHHQKSNHINNKPDKIINSKPDKIINKKGNNIINNKDNNINSKPDNIINNKDNNINNEPDNINNELDNINNEPDNINNKPGSNNINNKLSELELISRQIKELNFKDSDFEIFRVLMDRNFMESFRKGYSEFINFKKYVENNFDKNFNPGAPFVFDVSDEIENYLSEIEAKLANLLKSRNGRNVGNIINYIDTKIAKLSAVANHPVHYDEPIYLENDVCLGSTEVGACELAVFDDVYDIQDKSKNKTNTVDLGVLRKEWSAENMCVSDSQIQGSSNDCRLQDRDNDSKVQGRLFFPEEIKNDPKDNGDYFKESDSGKKRTDKIKEIEEGTQIGNNNEHQNQKGLEMIESGKNDTNKNLENNSNSNPNSNPINTNNNPLLNSNSNPILNSNSNPLLNSNSNPLLNTNSNPLLNPNNTNNNPLLNPNNNSLNANSNPFMSNSFCRNPNITNPFINNYQPLANNPFIVQNIGQQGNSLNTNQTPQDNQKIDEKKPNAFQNFLKSKKNLFQNP